MDNWLERARKASNLTLEDCASALKCSRATFEARIKRPGTLNINELRVLSNLFVGEGQTIAREALRDIVPNFFAN